jgi:hypothetical protein
MTNKRKIFLGLTLFTLLIAFMGLFSFLKKSAPQTIIVSSIDPYKDSSTNFIYNLLFCDNLNLYKEKTQKPYSYPFDIIFSDSSSILDLQKIIEDKDSDPRIKILAYNKLISNGQKSNNKELLAVIVEVGLENGLDVLASFNNGTARYINQTGKVLVWETTNYEVANKITNELFAASENIVKQIGVWEKPRLTNPTKGNVRITFLVSDGLYFGEGPMNVLFSDPMASPALTKATELMQFLTQKSLEKNK